MARVRIGLGTSWGSGVAGMAGGGDVGWARTRGRERDERGEEKQWWLCHELYFFLAKSVNGDCEVRSQHHA